MDLEYSLDRMCMGLDDLNFRLVRIEIAFRKQNLRIRSGEPAILIEDFSSAQDVEEQGQTCP